MASVNRPVNEKQKEADINNKLQLYGIFSAFAAGKMPSNKQIDIAMNSALQHTALQKPSPKLSQEGQRLVADLRDAIEKTKILILTKNQGNLVQDFIWQTSHVDGASASTPNAPVGRDTAKRHGQEAIDDLRTLGTLIISNGQFRKLLSDATILLRDMAGDAAQKAADRVNPSEDELNQIDDEADENTWHDVPKMSRDDLKNKVKNKYHEQKPFSREDMKEAGRDATQAAHPSGSRDPRDAADLAARDQRHGTSSGMDAQHGAKTAINSLRDRAEQNMPEETKDRARNYRDRTKNYMKEKLPQERRDQIIHRMKKMVVEIQGHQDYQRAIDSLFRMAREYKGHTKNLAEQATGTVKQAHGDNSLQTAEADLKTLIERFANSTSLDDLFDSINEVYRDADNDPELKGWFRKMDTYIQKCLKQQGYILQDSATDEWNQLSEHGEYLLRDRYRNHTDRIVDEFKFIADQFNEDAQNKAFADAMQKLFLDLGNDENGKATFKPHLLKDLSDVIVPGILESVRYVPIPRIEYSDPMIDAVVENLVIESDNLAPNVLEIGSDNYFRWGRKKISNRNKNKVMISVSGIQMDLRDVSYYVKKKQGFPSVTDIGVADFFLGGSGLSFKIEMENADKSDGTHFFKVNSVNINMEHVNISLKQSKHKLLFGLFKPLLLKVLRPVIQKVLEKQIKNNIHQLDAMLYDVYKEAKRAEEEAKRNPDPENAQNMYQRYASAAQKKFTQGKQKKDEAAADKKVNMAITQHDSIFPNIKLPGGISSKATEYKELARKGDKWESPIFTIGSAKETTNLPKIPAVSRKPHRVTEGGVRGDRGDLKQASGTGAGYDQTNGANNFSSQVNQAFDGAADYSLGKTGGMNGSASYGTAGYGNTGYDTTGMGSTGAYGATGMSATGGYGVADASYGPTGGYGTVDELPSSTGHTLLGTHNPVLTGLAPPVERL